MRYLHLALACMIALPAVGRAGTPDVTEDLKAYYENGAKMPAYNAAIKKLASADGKERDQASAWLVALLDQALKDEQSGTAPWRATPFWGSSGENPARKLRQAIADAITTAPASPATLTVIRWYLDREPVLRFQQNVLPALDRIRGAGVAELCLGLLQPPHDNSVVAIAALQQLGKRKAKVPAAVLAALCDHYRPSLRAAARRLNQERGGPDPGPFNAAKAMQRPALVALMSSIGTLLDQPASADAEFVRVTTTRTADQETETIVGWLVKNHGDSWIVRTPFGYREAFQKERVIDGRGDGKVVVKSAWQKHAIADEVQRVVALRKKDDPNFALSERGGLTGQFQGQAAGVYEVTLAHWLYTTKQFDLAAQLLLPALDTFYRDRDLVDMVRHRTGEAVGYRMLVAFVGDRDFAETQRLAQALVTRYPDTRFHQHAVALAKEMPKRMADAQTLKLPTAKAWAMQKQKMSRAEQITFLAQRLRMLNCFQRGQPGGYSIRDVQYAEPSGLSRDAAWSLGRGKTKVINPYVELVGGSEGVFDKQENRRQGLELTVANIPLLAPFLRDDWHLLCVSFWRNFHPDRRLATTRPLVAEIMNDLAKRDLCRVGAMGSMPAAEIDAHIASISRWAKDNAGKSEADLLWAPLDERVRAGAYFNELPNVAALVAIKDKRLGPVLRTYLDGFATKGARPNPNEFKIQGLDTSAATYTLRALLDLCRAYEPAAFQEPARKLLKHKNLSVRLSAAHLLFGGGSIAEGRAAFADILENGSPWELEEDALPKVVKTLLTEGSAASKQAARLVFKNQRYTEIREGRVRVALVKQCAAAGMGDGYLSYIPLLDIKGNAIGNISYAEGTVVGEVIAKEIIELLAPDEPAVQRIGTMFTRAADQIAPLKAWLRMKAKAPQ